MGAAVVCMALAFIGAVVGWIRCVAAAARQRKRFALVVDVEAEATRVRAQAVAEMGLLRRGAVAEVAAMRTAAAAESARVDQESAQSRHAAQDLVASAHAERARVRAVSEHELAGIRQSIQEERARQGQMASSTAVVRRDVEQLRRELATLEGNLEDISFGLYRPQYRFDTPEQFKAEMERVYGRQKELVRAGKAASFQVAWTVGNSRREGERMQKQYCKLLLRAFNGECDAAIAKVAWNNASRMEERIRKAFEAINELGGVMTVSLAAEYRELKLAELRLEHELVEKKREIAEEQRRIREQMKDEEKAVREAERAQAEAEDEEQRFAAALEQAKVELVQARGAEHARLNEQIVGLQAQLAQAHAKSTRARSLAEMTKAGYVYVISNVGAFGEQVFKIGMTRRSDPTDRVRELGGASVPFPFDVHAMVYSEDAPALEAAFHREFRDRSVNLVNARKEFFRVDVSEIEAFARKCGLAMVFTRVAEAREYRESMAVRGTRKAA